MVRIRWQAAVAASAVMIVPGIVARAASTIHWQTSFAVAKATAKRTHKLILTDFYADW